LQNIVARQKDLIQEISKLKETILENSIELQSMELDENEEIVHFSVPETKCLQYFCRYPRCNSKLASTSSRLNHEKNQHSQNKFTCAKCNIVAERKETIENHKLRMHHGTRAIKFSRLYVISVI
jgi:hypothetical protein